MKNTFVLVILGIIVAVSFCYAMGQRSASTGPDTAMETNANTDANTNADVNTNTDVNANADVNARANINASTNSGVTTSMNGSTSTSSGVPISSTSASKESRSVSGSGS